MDEIKALDQKLFMDELISQKRWPQFVLWLLVFAALVMSKIQHSIPLPPVFIPIFGVTYTGFQAYKDSIKKRFKQKRFLDLWNGCQERLERFETVLKKAQKSQVAALEEMPDTVRKVSGELYVALRRADVVSGDVEETEREFINKPPAWESNTSDAQSQELYKISDRNIAEYRQRYKAVMAGVQRTEAQSAVFMTTLDILRMKMLTYKFVGKSPEMATHDFLSSLAEAKLQLSAIDKALDELELGPYPSMVAVVPSGPPAFTPPEPAEPQKLETEN